jgi:arylsulfatase A-like enzyme
MWEGGLRVPFIVRWPDELPAGKVYHKPVLSLDIYPTVLAATGVEPPNGYTLDGHNMLPALRGERTEPLHRTIAWGGAHHTPASNPHFGEKAGHAEAPYAWAVRQGPWRMIDAGDGPRLYNLNEDIGEQDDVIESHPKIAKQLKRAYRNWLNKMQNPQNWPAKYWKGKMEPDGPNENDN